MQAICELRNLPPQQENTISHSSLDHTQPEVRDEVPDFLLTALQPLQQQSHQKLTYWTELGKGKLITKPVLGKHDLKPAMIKPTEIKTKQIKATPMQREILR